MGHVFVASAMRTSNLKTIYLANTRVATVIVFPSLCLSLSNKSLVGIALFVDAA